MLWYVFVIGVACLGAEIGVRLAVWLLCPMPKDGSGRQHRRGH